MIKAIIFDLDGTLVQTEILKAHSYGKAMSGMTAGQISESEVVQSFSDLVGLSRNEVARQLIEKYRTALNRNISEEKGFAAGLLIKTRLEIYEQMLLDAAVLPAYACPYSTQLLKTAKELGYITGLATMSYNEQVQKVTRILNLNLHIDHLLTRDGVEKGKPDPEIYIKMLHIIGIEPYEAIVIEDSVSGIRAAQTAGITVFGVTNDITRKAVTQSGILHEKFIVNDPSEIVEKVFHYIESLLA